MMMRLIIMLMMTTMLLMSVSEFLRASYPPGGFLQPELLIEQKYCGNKFSCRFSFRTGTLLVAVVTKLSLKETFFFNLLYIQMGLKLVI